MSGRQRQILGFHWGTLWDRQLLPEEWDEAVYDDILERIRLRRSLDLLGGSPDLSGDGPKIDRLGPPYRLTREIYARRRREEREAAGRERREAERQQAWDVWKKQFDQARAKAWSKVRLEPMPSGTIYTCAGCGLVQPILLPPPGWGGTGNWMCGGRFIFTCRCGAQLGMISKKLMAECAELRQIVNAYGWHAGPSILPPGVKPLLDTRVTPPYQR